MITLRFSLPPVNLRRNHGGGKFVNQDRADYSERMLAELLQQKQALLALARAGAPLEGPLKLTIVWEQTGRGDVDNCLASAKATIDAMGCAPQRAGQRMTYLGVWEDDSQVEEITVRRRRVPTKADEGVVVEIHADNS
jgi:Holliday junction resolvase RusA-like endonuclease